MKIFNTMRHVGKARYVINHHDGVKTHPDGSPFFDIIICRNRGQFQQACRQLSQDGYVERHGA